MAFVTKALRVLFTVVTTFSQRDDVISLGCWPHYVMLSTVNAQRRALEQLRSQRLQLATSDALGCGHWFSPSWTLMLATATAAINHKDVAARCSARLGG